MCTAIEERTSTGFYIVVTKKMTFFQQKYINVGQQFAALKGRSARLAG